MGISRKTNDDGLRWYSTDDGVTAMSVTTVLDFLEEDTTGLERWKEQNDGVGDNPHHEHIFWYSAPRGTLCHYQALCTFDSAFDGEDMWGEEETESMQMATNGPDADAFDEASTESSDVVYSILKNKDIVSDRDEYEALFKDNTRLVDLIKEDTDYFHETFKTICDELGVTEESVIRVEKFMLNEDDNYGGQCDLVYEDPNGNVVVADLKTSSGLRQKHRLQSVAYMKGIEQAEWGPDDVDRVEVWRIQPDDKEWQVHSNKVPSHAEHLADGTDSAHYTDQYWFEDKWGDFEYDSIEDMWETFQTLTKTAHDSVQS